jgi:hypothetical protein
MATTDLLKGIGVLIDDAINDENSGISNIVAQIETNNIPLLKYNSIPSPEIYSNFINLSFIVLDWEIIDDELREMKSSGSGIKIPKGVIDDYENENIIFIKNISRICYCPIFIISDLKERVVERLMREKLYWDQNNRPNHIFIKSKNELRGKKRLFNKINKWIASNPSVYVLKKWENQYQKSKNKLFIDFQNLSNIWPRVFWKTYEEDNVNKSLELGELISRNLQNRMAPFEFEETILSKTRNKIDQEEIKRVLEGERFLKKGNLNKDVSTGDLFTRGEKKGYYYLNIRAACDLIPGRSKPGCDESISLYLIEGSSITHSQARKIFNKDYGMFSEIESHSIIFPFENKAIRFNFKNLVVMDWSKIKNDRVGRILPPYINKIQQKYAAYL